MKRRPARRSGSGCRRAPRRGSRRRSRCRAPAPAPPRCDGDRHRQRQRHDGDRSPAVRSARSCGARSPRRAGHQLGQPRARCETERPDIGSNRNSGPPLPIEHARSPASRARARGRCDFLASRRECAAHCRRGKRTRTERTMLRDALGYLRSWRRSRLRRWRRPDRSGRRRSSSDGRGGVTGVFFPVGVALAAGQPAPPRHRPALRRPPDDGSVANIAGLRDGSLELAIVQSDTQAQAAAGTPLRRRRAVRQLARGDGAAPRAADAGRRGDAGVAGVEDLAGKRVWLGRRARAPARSPPTLMGALGWTGPASRRSRDRRRPAGRRPLPRRDRRVPLCHRPPGTGDPGGDHRLRRRLVPVGGPPSTSWSTRAPTSSPRRFPAGCTAATPTGRELRGRRHPRHPRRPAERPHQTRWSDRYSRTSNAARPRAVLTALEPEAMASDGLTAPLHPGAARYYRERGWLE